MESKLLDNESIKHNFDTLISAVENDHICLLDCIDKRTNEHVPVICVVSHLEDTDGNITEDTDLLPFAVMFTENPYTFLIPPSEYLKEDNNVHDEL